MRCSSRKAAQTLSQQTTIPTFSELLKRHRLAAGITQEELAQRAGLSLRGVGDLERGTRRTPRKDTVKLLANALGLSSDEMAVLEVSVRRLRAIASPSFSAIDRSPASSADTMPSRPIGNLPTPLTSLVGREHEEATAVHLLRRNDIRLLTLTGAPGIGKTRLALQVAADLREDTPDGVFLVELAPIVEPTLVLAAILHAMEAPETPGQTPLAALTAHLRPRRLLLVLDNFEQVIAASTQIVELLHICPDLKALVTSRIPLQVRGEHRLAVLPLELADPTALPPVEDLIRYPSIVLFLQRAREVKPTFVLTPVEAPAVAAICHRLDGLPLAIELAAAWTRLLSPTALLVRLDHRLPLLTAGARDLMERQQTVRSAIDWSHNLLAPAQQRLLRSLSVFVGGWSLEAAEAVCSASGEDAAVLPALATLVDASLVDHHEAANGEVRFRLLGLVREYALERLEASGEAEGLRARHARYFLEFVQQLRTTAVKARDAWLLRENENLAAALTWAGEHDRAAAMAAGAELWQYWPARRMLLHESRRWLEGFRELHAGMSAETPPALRARMLNAVGNLAREQGNYILSTACYEEALALARSVNLRRLVANLLNNLANIGMAEGDFVRAEALYREAMAVRQELARTLDAARAAERNGHLDPRDWDALWNEVKPDEMTDLAERAVVLTRLAESNAEEIAKTFYNMAQLAMLQGDMGQAKVQCEQARELFAEGGWVSSEALARSLLGEILAHLGDQEQARSMLEEVVFWFRAQDAKWELADALHRLGWVARVHGEAARAVALHQEALALSQEIGDRRGLAVGLEWLGMAEAAMGRAEVATRLLGAGATLRQSLKFPSFPIYWVAIEQATSDLRERLGEERFATIWEAGASTPVEQLLVTDAQ
jgi:predicted ATPase/transcriptional regulator with XRE-family HTH domain